MNLAPGTLLVATNQASFYSCVPHPAAEFWADPAFLRRDDLVLVLRSPKDRWVRVVTRFGVGYVSYNDFLIDVLVIA